MLIIAVIALAAIGGFVGGACVSSIPAMRMGTKIGIRAGLRAGLERGHDKAMEKIWKEIDRLEAKGIGE